MRNGIAALIFTLLNGAAFGQDVSRVYRFTAVQNAQGYQEAANGVRAIGGVEKVTVDPTGGILTASGSVEQMALVDWLLPQVDQPASGGIIATGSYQMSGDAGMVRVFHLTRATSPREMQEVVNVLRTSADIARITPLSVSRAVVARGTADQIALTEWLVAQLDVSGPDASAKTQSNRFRDEEVRVFHLAHTASPQAIQELVNSIRTIADLNRVFPCNTAAAVVLRGPAPYVEVAEWLVGQLDVAGDQPAPGPHEQEVKAPYDPVARVFYLHHAQAQTLVRALRTTVSVRRIFPCAQAKALAMRGTADQMAQAEKLIAQLDQ
ncbi:MAG TPA: secretin N-terminal domain-containing protein [Candidatus Sulfopaludibacter sp.]|nr:secretin N-terminal domain-containing protein [Candidatus Sulfopaludibacter sp.]